VKHLENA